MIHKLAIFILPIDSYFALILCSVCSSVKDEKCLQVTFPCIKPVCKPIQIGFFLFTPLIVPDPKVIFIKHGVAWHGVTWHGVARQDKVKNGRFIAGHFYFQAQKKGT